MHDKNGTEIKAGDTLFNQYDRDQYHTVLQGEDGKLYLGDLDSPLERYAPQTWWEVVHNAEHQACCKASPECSGSQLAKGDTK